MHDRRVAVPGSFVGALLVLVLAALYLLRLVPQAAHARLYMDEPFHAHVAEWIAHHGALPRELPEFYSGLPYFYPPLLHLIAAGWVALLGGAALPYLNLVLTAAFEPHPPAEVQLATETVIRLRASVPENHSLSRGT